MTRDAVREQLRLVSEAVGEGWRSRFSVTDAAGLGWVPSFLDRVVVFFVAPGVDEEFTRLHAGYERGLKAALDYAEEEALGSGSFEKYKGEIVASDRLYACYDGEDAEPFADALVERYRGIGEALAPLVESDEDGFWDAACDVYGKDETLAAVDSMVGYADTVEPYADGVSLHVPVSSWTVDCTNEALSALRETEDEVRGRMKEKADAVY